MNSLTSCQNIARFHYFPGCYGYRASSVPEVLLFQIFREAYNGGERFFLFLPRHRYQVIVGKNLCLSSIQSTFVIMPAMMVRGPGFYPYLIPFRINSFSKVETFSILLIICKTRFYSRDILIQLCYY